MSLLRNRTANSAPDFDMTPMVDVTFLLLIFFMVTAAFTMQKSMVVAALDSGAYVGIPEISLLTLK